MAEAVAVQRCKADKLPELELSDCQRLIVRRELPDKDGGRGKKTNQPSSRTLICCLNFAIPKKSVSAKL